MRLVYRILMLPLLTGLLACSNDLDRPADYSDGMGGLNLSAETKTSVIMITKGADFSTVDVNNFNVKITDQAAGKVFFNDTYQALKDSLPLVMPLGNYTVIAGSRKTTETTVSEIPYFMNRQEFVIEENTTTNVSLTCTFESLGVELVLSEQFQQKIAAEPHNYSYEVVVSNGLEQWSFTPDQMKPGYFLADCDELVVTVRVRLGSANQWYPNRVYRIKNAGNAPKLGEYYVITLDAGETPETTLLKTSRIIEQEG